MNPAHDPQLGEQCKVRGTRRIKDEHLSDIDRVEPVVVGVVKHAGAHDEYKALQFVHWHFDAGWDVQLLMARKSHRQQRSNPSKMKGQA